MPEFGPTHPLTYRTEIAAPLFDLLRAGESATIIGSASMGKSRLLQFLLRSDVQQHYLGDTAATTWLVLADCNRLARLPSGGSTSCCSPRSPRLRRDGSIPALRDWLNDLRREAITGGISLLAGGTLNWRRGAVPRAWSAALLHLRRVRHGVQSAAARRSGQSARPARCGQVQRLLRPGNARSPGTFAESHG